MTKKRRNGGKNRHGRGSVKPIRCSNCGRSTPKDKAVKRMLVRNMIETAGQRDVIEASVYEVFAIPKLYTKLMYCISCAVHAHVVRVRSAEDRRNRAPPQRQKKAMGKDEQKKGGAPGAKDTRREPKGGLKEEAAAEGAAEATA
eukprot:GILI01010173.1.p2 GENE.GILI01010173.1~~GILI01010173.1.p2  ORF type:complete len:155 (+),score=46.64 GILI01010173.1:35-466(+)